MVVALTAVLLVVMQATASSAYTCQFYLSTAKVTCGGVTCTAATSWWYKLLPAGFYRIGPKNSGKSVPWYNLYPYSDKNYWDYHSEVPALGCRGGFALHGGSFSEGCITVTDNDCMAQIESYLNGLSSSTFTVNECKDAWGPNCLFSNCQNGIGTLSRSYIGSLKVYN